MFCELYFTMAHKVKKIFVLLLLLLTTTTFINGFQILQNSSQTLQEDNYKIHCCYSDFCLINLDNNKIRITQNDCLILDSNDFIKYQKLTFFSMNRQYEVSFNSLDCQINKTIDYEAFKELIKVSCKKPHFIEILEQPKNLLTQFNTNENDLTTDRIKEIKIKDKEQTFFIYIDNSLVKIITTPKKAMLSAKIEKTKDAYIVKITTNKPLHCSIKPNTGYTLPMNEFDIQQYLEFSLEPIQIQNSEIKPAKQPTIYLKCQDKDGFNYIFSKTYYTKEPNEETPSTKFLNWLKSYWAILIAGVIIYFIYSSYRTYKVMNATAKEQLEKER